MIFLSKKIHWNLRLKNLKKMYLANNCYITIKINKRFKIVVKTDLRVTFLIHKNNRFPNNPATIQYY